MKAVSKLLLLEMVSCEKAGLLQLVAKLNEQVEFGRKGQDKPQNSASGLSLDSDRPDFTIALLIRGFWIEPVS